VVRGRGDDEAAAREAVDLEQQHVRGVLVDGRVEALEVRRGSERMSASRTPRSVAETY
jgi:hypothetical protein